MRYKVVVNGVSHTIWDIHQQYEVYCGSVDSSTKDRVILTFNEDTQSFIAKIENPSPKTLDLFNRGKLGFGISRCNFGKKDHWHRGGDNMSSVNATMNGTWSASYNDPIKNAKKAKYHPRWSRVVNNLTKVTDLEYIEIPASRIPGPGHHEYTRKTIVWNYYRGLLVSIVGNPDSINTMERTRSLNYKTNCKSIKLNYSKSTGRYSIPTPGESILDVNATLIGNNTYQIFINNITGSFLNMYQNNYLMIGVKYYGPLWSSSGHGSSWHRGSNSSNQHRISMGMEKDNLSKRHYGHRVQSQTVQNLMFNFSPDLNLAPYQHLTRLSGQDGHRTYDVKIDGTCEIYLYYHCTGHKICSLVTGIPYNTWYEDQYWDYNDE